MYALRSIPNKGLGLIATSSIARGTRILSDTALLRLTPSSPSILAQAHKLTAARLDSLLSLVPSHRKTSAWNWLYTVIGSRTLSPRKLALNHNIESIWRNNNFHISDGVRALFPEIARVNHCCVPNSQGNYNEGLKETGSTHEKVDEGEEAEGKFTLHAIRPIEAGEEITISYLADQLAVRENRMDKLREGYGFECACPACTQSPPSPSHDQAPERKDSLYEQGETRRRTFASQLAAFSNLTPEKQNARGEYDLMLNMLDTYKGEGLRGREVASLCIATAKKAIELGLPIEECAALAMRGLKLEREAVGNDSPFFVAAQRAVEDMGIRV